MKEEEEVTMSPTTHQIILYLVAASALVRSVGILMLKQKFLYFLLKQLFNQYTK